VDAKGYLCYNLTSDYDLTKKVYTISAHRLFGIIFNDNNDIFRNTDCDHIDRFRWCNRPENTIWITSIENQNNKCTSNAKIDRKHNKTDISYLENWIAHMEFLKVKKNDHSKKNN
jgi:hypothetical protein